RRRSARWIAGTQRRWAWRRCPVSAITAKPHAPHGGTSIQRRIARCGQWESSSGRLSNAGWRSEISARHKRTAARGAQRRETLVALLASDRILALAHAVDERLTPRLASRRRFRARTARRECGCHAREDHTPYANALGHGQHWGVRTGGVRTGGGALRHVA